MMLQVGVSYFICEMVVTGIIGEVITTSRPISQATVLQSFLLGAREDLS